MSETAESNGAAGAFAAASDGDHRSFAQPGLTKREYFAAMAMQGILAGGFADTIPYNSCDCEDEVSSVSVRVADALLAALESGGAVMSGKHTPTPWASHYEDSGFYYLHADGAPSPYIVATGGEGETDEANAARIVHCVNNFDAVVEALRALSKHTAIWNNPCSPKDAEVNQIVQDALALAESQS